MTSSHNTTPPPASPAAGRKSCTTFAALFVEHRRIAKDCGRGAGTITFHISSTRRFLRSLGLDEMADPSFLADAEVFRRETARAATALGYVAGSQDERGLRSGVAQLRQTFLLRLDAAPIIATAPESFPDFWSAYQYYGKIAFKLGFLGGFPSASRQYAGVRRRPNSRLLVVNGISSLMVQMLKTGVACVADAGMELRFQGIEKLLHAPHGSLARHVTFRGGRTIVPERRTKHGIRSGEALKFPYGVKIGAWPEHLQQEVREFIDDKKEVNWTTRRDGYCGSEETTVSGLEEFVGWLVLPKGGSKWRSGLGRDLGSIQSVFAELVTPQTIDRYGEFRVAHTLRESEYASGEGRPVFNTGIRNLYHFAAHLLRPPHKTKRNRPAGFVFRNFDRYAGLLGHQLPTTSYDREKSGFVTHLTPSDRWVAFCGAARGHMFDVLDGAVETGKAGKSRPAEAGIEEILALANPRAAIAVLLNACQRDYDGYTWETQPWEKAFNCRRQVFFELIAITPHRVRLWALLARRNFSCRNDAQGRRCYHLHVDRPDFKNHRYLDVDYELDLPARLTPLLDDHFNRAWSILNAPSGTFQAWRDQNNNCAFLRNERGGLVPVGQDHRYAELKQMQPGDRVFGCAIRTALLRNRAAPVTPLHRTKLVAQSLQRLSETTTGRFLGDQYGTNGFRPHAFRHITATAEIRTTGSFERAALLLWDSVEMVMMTYSHVKRSDLLAGVLETQEADFATLRSPSPTT